MRRIIFVAIGCLLLAGLTLSGCSTEVNHEFTLTVSSPVGGSVTAPGQGTFSYDTGTVVDLVAEAQSGYQFAEWTGDVGTVADTKSASTTITMTEDCELLASFEEIPPVQHALTISSTAGGSITTPGEGAYSYDEGTVVDLVAEAEEGYKFVTWSGDVDTIEDIGAADTAITMIDGYSITAIFESRYTPMVAGGIWHTVGLRSDGTVVAIGANAEGQCEVGGWTDIVQVAGGHLHTVGLKSDGTMVAVGGNDYGQLDVDGWTGIIQIDAGKHHTVALKLDGTVVATGWNDYGQCAVGGWTDIVQVVAGFYHTVGLKSDGTVVAVGVDTDRRLEVGEWTEIIAVAAGAHHTVGLRPDGTVVAVGRNAYGECNVADWTDIGELSAGCGFTVGLRSDGTVVAVGDNQYGACETDNWTDVVQVSAGGWHTVALKHDGGVVAIGNNNAGRCDVGDWMLT
jgi:alpha-tubulin suppressor-like RCC1 family protein